MSIHGEVFAPLLEAFAEHERLRQRVATVLSALPTEVLHDFVHDPRFRISKLETSSSVRHHTVLALPAPDGSGSRCVVLKARLAECSEAFGLYVIAHELAHAYLRNGSWGEFDDPEEAADALASLWGFPKPGHWFR